MMAHNLHNYFIIFVAWAYCDAAPESFSPVMPIGICPGETANFTCTVVDSSGPPSLGSVVWTGSAFDNFQCDEIRLFTANFWRGTSESCGNGAVVARATGVDGDCYTSNLAVVMSRGMDDTTIECRLSTIRIGSPHVIRIADYPTAPSGTSITFIEGKQEFIFQWNRSTAVSTIDIDGFMITINGPGGGLMCEDPNLDPDAEMYSCEWSTAAISQTYTLHVAAVNCGDQVGPDSIPVTVSLQVPNKPALTVCPVYNSIGGLLRIESYFTTLPALMIANGVSESPIDYMITYSDGLSFIVPSEACVADTCSHVYTLASTPEKDEYTISVAARNTVGVGVPATSNLIGTTNRVLKVMIDPMRRIVHCKFLNGFTGTAKCQITYGTDASNSNFPFTDSESNSTGDIVTVELTTSLDQGPYYYYLLTATSESVCVKVQGLFKAACDCSNLTNLPTGDCDLDGGILGVANGQVIYTGTSLGLGQAVYKCDEGYQLDGTSTRPCLLDGTWKGSQPVCKGVRELSIGATVSITVPVCSITFLIVGVLFGASVYHGMLTRNKRAPKQQLQVKLPDLASPGTRLPEYETITISTTEQFALHENVAYGDVHK